MKKQIVLMLIVSGFILSAFFPLSSKASSSCWQKPNGRYSFGDANKDYSSLRDCEAAYVYYLVVKEGKSTDCMAINPQDHKYHSGGQVFDTPQACTAFMMSKYNMTESRTTAQSTTQPSTKSTCNFYTEKATFKQALHSKVDEFYLELLKRNTNLADYAFWDNAQSFVRCGQSVDETAIRELVLNSDEYKTLQAASINIVNDTAAQQNQPAPTENKSGEPEHGFWANVKSLPSKIVTFFKNLFS